MSEVVLVMGYPAGGKTTYVQSFLDQGYTRINRDTIGGSISNLAAHLDVALKSGKSVVMDNLFPTVESRKPFIDLASKYKVPVRCVFVNTSLEDAQFNACLRMIDRAGKVLDPKAKTDDPNLFPVAVIYKYRKEFQKPTTAEGFAKVETANFVRTFPSDWTNEAIIFDYDGTLRDTKSGDKYPKSKDDIVILKGRKEKLQELAKQGKLLLGVSNQSGVAKGELSEAVAHECFKETNRLLGVDIEYRFCPHKVPPITCYCRKPGPGLGVELIVKHKLNPKKCVFVGDLSTDKSFAARCGFQFVLADQFFKG